MEDHAVSGPLSLGAFLKVVGVAGTGGHAKILVQSREVRVNGEVETRRGRALHHGDVVAISGREYRVCSSPG
jgi:ribosome-associated protein